jgi:two-component system chemotaxis response regulator CheY
VTLSQIALRQKGERFMARKILAVDDSASIRQMVSFTLKSAGHTVVEAVDGADGIARHAPRSST